MNKVSVIVPVYNCENYINKCVNSILNQTYKNVELILINDGSTDSSKDIISQFPAIIVNKKNGGVSSARNEGLKCATGDFVMFVDCDDYLDYNCIENCIKKNADIVRFELCYEELDGTYNIEEGDFTTEKHMSKSDFKKEIYLKILTGIKLNSVCRTLYKKSVIENVKFDENMPTAEDLVFNIQAFTNANSFQYIKKPYYHYLQTKSGLTGGGLSISAKYKYNIMASKIMLATLKYWGMDRVQYRFLAVLRPFIITISKIRRKLFKC